MDLLIERGEELVPVEVKSGSTAAADFFDPIERWRAIAGEAAGRGWVVYGGGERQSRQRGELVGWRGIRELGEEGVTRAAPRLSPP